MASLVDGCLQARLLVHGEILALDAHHDSVAGVFKINRSSLGSKFGYPI
jgi:hypothetical protein